MIYDLLPYRELKVWAEMYADAQDNRIAMANRIRSADVIGDVFTSGLDAAEKLEHDLGLQTRRQYRKTVPAGVIAWQKESKGIGEHLLARLIGHLGHPRIATPSHWEGAAGARKLVADMPFERSVGNLWQFCGHGAPGRVRKGMTQDELFALGNPTLKKLVHLLAEGAIKQPGRTIPQPAISIPQPTRQTPAEAPLRSDHTAHDIQPLDVGADLSPQPATGSSQPIEAAPAEAPCATETNRNTQPSSAPSLWPYRAVYETRRQTTADRTHADLCVRCGPAGRPAQPGTPWSKAHQHADALRVVGKAILRDLWLAAGDQPC